MKVDRCPRCGQPGYLFADIRELKSATQVYYFVVHRYKEGDKWKTRKCAIGSDGYVYVTKTHNLPFIGVNLKFSSITSFERHAELVRKSIADLRRRLLLVVASNPGRLDIERARRVVDMLIREVTELKKTVDKLGGF